MIHAVRANQPSFRTVEFKSGFNVVLADRTKESTKKDSRNGLGKSTLIEIIHFCLGASTKPQKGLRVDALASWVFSLELSVGTRRLVAHRSTEDPSHVRVEGDTSGWEAGERAGDALLLHFNDWTSILGEEMFGVPQKSKNDKYLPTFRSLIGYFARRGRDAFSDPFEHFRKQSEWDKQVNNAYLLGLSWENAKAWQELKDQGKVLDTLKTAVIEGLVEGMIGSVGELEAEKVRLEEETRRQAEELATFRVHPEYREIEKRASQLTAEIHDLNNQNVADRRMLEYYRRSLEDVGDTEPDSVTSLYAEAGVKLPGVVVRRLEDVQSFHRQLIENRRDFLSQEVQRYKGDIEDRETRIEALSDQRAKLMRILQEHGALEEYTLLQQRHLETTAKVQDVENRLLNLKKFDKGKSALKIDRERLLQRARRDHDERHEARERAISLFNSHSQALYEAPGRLVIDIGDNGFKFNVEIERDSASGIENMKVFCYDLMLAQLWAGRPLSPGFLIHDSSLFAEVDERQVAHGLERAMRTAQATGFQYICTLNSDTLPLREFPEGFNIQDYVRLRLTDDKQEGSLLGIRF